MTPTPREELIEALAAGLFAKVSHTARAEDVVDALDAHVMHIVTGILDAREAFARESSRHREAAEGGTKEHDNNRIAIERNLLETSGLCWEVDPENGCRALLEFLHSHSK